MELHMEAALRRYEEKSPDDGDERNGYQHDRDRVLYASSFRRLAGVTQVASVDERHSLHNRLTHSLKVAHLARRMAEYVNGSKVAPSAEIDADVAETAGLMHDLGHPPFGHAAEEELNELMKDYGGFEGNAQSFRIVTRLAARTAPNCGLNLTRRTLNASLKYPCCYACKRTPAEWTDRSRGKKWGVYDEDLDYYLWVRQADEACHARESQQQSDNGPQRTAESLLVDWADDVSYATHDLEDYYRAGLIPLDKVLKGKSDGFIDSVRGDLEQKHGSNGFDADLFDAARQDLRRRHAEVDWHPFKDRRSDRERIRWFASANIHRFVGGITYSSEKPYVRVTRIVQYEVEILKHLTMFYVIEKPGLAMAQRGQRRLISGLFEELVAILESDEPDRRTMNAAPEALRELLAESSRSNEQARRRRAVCDYISSLTEAQAVDLHARLTSANGGTSIFGTWF